MDDEMLKALAKTDGVVQIVGFSGYIKAPKPDSPERAAALKALRAEFKVPDPEPRQASGAPGSTRAMQEAIDALPAPRRAQWDAKVADIDKRLPPDPPATVKDFVNHIDYAVKLIGIDHVGISSDFDGGGGLADWKDASETFNVTLELVRRGYTEEQIGKIWSGNLLRVMERAQAVAREIQGGR
jgi:membrane dipeptidase